MARKISLLLSLLLLLSATGVCQKIDSISRKPYVSVGLSGDVFYILPECVKEKEYTASDDIRLYTSALSLGLRMPYPNGNIFSFDVVYGVQSTNWMEGANWRVHAYSRNVMFRLGVGIPLRSKCTLSLYGGFLVSSLFTYNVDRHYNSSKTTHSSIYELLEDMKTKGGRFAVGLDFSYKIAPQWALSLGCFYWSRSVHNYLMSTEYNDITYPHAAKCSIQLGLQYDIRIKHRMKLTQ